MGQVFEQEKVIDDSPTKVVDQQEAQQPLQPPQIELTQIQQELQQDKSTPFDTNPKLHKSVFDALTDYAGEVTETAVKISVLENILSGDQNFGADWKELKALTYGSLGYQDEEILERIRSDFSRSSDEKENLNEISSTLREAELLTAELDQMCRDFNDYEKTEETAKATPKESDSKISAFKFSLPTLKIGSPFEEAIEQTGLYDKVAHLISEVADNAVFPIIDEVRNSINREERPPVPKWSKHLAQERIFFAHNVMPELALEAILDITPRMSAIQKMILEVEGNPTITSEATWPERQKLWQEKIDSVTKNFEAGYQGLKQTAQKVAVQDTTTLRRGSVDSSNKALNDARRELKSLEMSVRRVFLSKKMKESR